MQFFILFFHKLLLIIFILSNIFVFKTEMIKTTQ